MCQLIVFVIEGYYICEYYKHEYDGYNIVIHFTYAHKTSPKIVITRFLTLILINLLYHFIRVNSVIVTLSIFSQIIHHLNNMFVLILELLIINNILYDDSIFFGKYLMDI